MSKIKDKVIKFLNLLYVMLVSRGDFILLNGWLNIKFGRVQKRNFGDELNYYLLHELTKKHIVGYYDIWHVGKHDDLMFIGSLVEEFTTPNSIIWGSGAISGDKPLRHKPAKVCAVRGKLTRKYLMDNGVNCPEIYGDPALLLPLVYKPIVKKKYAIGIIPHISDLNNPLVQSLISNNQTHLINLGNYKDWHDVIDEICECDYIISSSLHGLIISDAYAIPNMWVKFSDKIEGGNFKYLDYFSGVGRKISKPIVIDADTDIAELQDYKKNYTPISFDSNALLAVAPIR